MFGAVALAFDCGAWCRFGSDEGVDEDDEEGGLGREAGRIKEADLPCDAEWDVLLLLLRREEDRAGAH